LSTPQKRIESLDLLKGLVMVLMALDHTRDYFHAPAFFYDPADPLQTSIPIYATRWITHFCAPVFSFLAGISVFFVSLKRTRTELSGFLVKRGLWLIFIELTIVTFAWYFNISFNTVGLLVIWALGISMLVLAGLVHLPKGIVLMISCLIIVGHNLLDNVHFSGNLLWAILHEPAMFGSSDGAKFYVDYPLLPWIAVMSLGYCFGSLYHSSFNPNSRKMILNYLGIAFIVLFLAIRGINIYGDPQPWTQFEVFTQTVMSFMNPAKYPPSLSYLLMTLGPALLFLANAESFKGKVVNFFQTFGRVPFFYYILHLYLIHLLALLAAELAGYGWEKMILNDWVTYLPSLQGYGFGLWLVYLVWFVVIGLLYPLCKKFDNYKISHKEKWYLGYL